MFTILLRTILIYVFLICIMRLMGKRQLGELEVTDLVITLLLSEISTIPITDKNTPVLYAGGVMSNRYLQARLRNACDASFAEPAFSADNAAGIALLCRERYLKTEASV